MNTIRPAVTLEHLAGFEHGYIFTWRVDPAYPKPAPYTFTVEEGNTPTGPWLTISPPTAEYIWQEKSRRVVNRDDTKYFRVKMVADGRVEYSPCIKDRETPDRRRELLLKEILRREMLVAKVHNGVPGGLYLRNRIGSLCTECTDPITQATLLGGFCPVCGGTRTVPPFYGPYPSWLTFTPGQRITKDGPEGLGKATYGTYTVRVASPVQLKSNDIIEEYVTRKLYNINTVNLLAEVSRVPVVQEVVVEELPSADPLYRLDIFGRTYEKASDTPPEDNDNEQPSP